MFKKEQAIREEEQTFREKEPVWGIEQEESGDEEQTWVRKQEVLWGQGALFSEEGVLNGKEELREEVLFIVEERNLLKKTDLIGSYTYCN